MVTTEEGAETNSWAAHHECMKASHLGTLANATLCDKLTFTSNSLYEDDFTANKAIKLLRRRPKDKPFFLHVSFPGPHDPFLITADMRASASDGRVW